MTRYETTDPRTGAVIAQYTLMTDPEIDGALNRSALAYERWSVESIGYRSEVLRGIARKHREQKEELSRLMSLEMGKPITQARGEIDLAASIFDYYASVGPELLDDEELDVAGGGRAVVRTSPLGPVLGIMPWNFPFYQVARFVAPNLLLGNTILLKHARSCTQIGMAIDEIVTSAGAPAGVYENLIASTEQIERIVPDGRLHGVSLTGSEKAGRAIGALAGQHLKKCVLELGGSDPFIVLPDADLESALGFAETGRFGNAGQSCTSSKRMIIHRDVWDGFLSSLVERAEGWQTGDPFQDDTRLGPMATEGGRAELAEQVADAVAKGATLHTGGRIPDGDGSYYPATVLSGVTANMRAYREELFGPVAVLHRVSSVDEAVAMANDSPFGLGAAVFTSDPETANDVAARLEVGMVGINTTVRSQPNLPFGGVKSSGIGRELGRYGLDEFSNKKLIRTL